ncbi:hypothetical protein K490DRAFT_59530 [Saccharata proteae CBS 121410]|uniref:F-box domain-containing protein n=1 Tax=Saccharata proteae CBS 121410 TaxID=1314787 RepID=A0A9P4HMW0_9PEZI|nr:hypothetical protein K490DRAFT_59530 [Saccharata proteae CBS 121410]
MASDAAVVAQPAKPPRRSLLDLPTELRYEIYSYLVTPPSNTSTTTSTITTTKPFFPGINTASVRVTGAFVERPAHGLILSCRQLHAEYLAYFHELATLKLTIHIWPPPTELPLFIAHLVSKYADVLSRVRNLSLAISNVPRWTNPSDAAGYLCTPFPDALIDMMLTATPQLRRVTVDWNEVYLFFSTVPVGIEKVQAAFEPLARLEGKVRVEAGKVCVKQSLPSLHTPPGAMEVEQNIRGAIEAIGNRC